MSMAEENREEASSSPFCKCINQQNKERMKKKTKGRKGDAVVVGLKLNDGTSREILTWALAKFTNPGDHVIALHVAPSPSSSSDSQAEVILCGKQGNAGHQGADIFDSVVGVYEGFCSIKKIDLQMKLVRGSLRKSLIEVAQSHNAVRLILGTNSNQVPFGRRSFSVAKYCSKRLPSTCSILVIQHGRVVYEKIGVWTSSGDTVEVANSTQQIMGSYHHKEPLQHAQGRSIEMSTSLIEDVTLPKCTRKHSRSISCSWSSHRRSMESALHVLHPYKYVPPQIHGLVFDMGVPSLKPSMPSSDAVREHCQGSRKGGINQKNILTLPKSAHGGSFKGAATGQRVSINYELDSRRHVKLGQKERIELRPVHRESCVTHKDNTTSHGWPLLHQSIQRTRTDNPRTRARSMSVVEWVLQLPERPNELSEQNSEPPDKEPLPFSSVNEKCMHHGTSSTVDRCNVVCHNKSVVVFDYTQLQDATDDFSEVNLVGKGGCSQVYRGVLLDGCMVAVKRLDPSAHDSKQAFHTEVEIISGLQHHCIIQLIGYCFEPQHHLLVYSYASEGSLEQQLHHSKTVLPWDVRHTVAVGVAEALHYLHDCCARPVIHRDVKSSNILLLSNRKPQLTDFGLAKLVPSTSSHITCSEVVGTFGYLAPEYFMYGRVNEKIDVFSFGVVLLELISGRHPIATAKPQGQENLVMWASPLLENESSIGKIVDPRLEGSYNENQLRNMINAAAFCLRPSPQGRPRISRILKLLTGECEAREVEQDSMRKGVVDEGYDEPNWGDCDIRSHLTLALLGLDDDAASQSGIDNSTNFPQSNRLLEEYFSRRYSRSSSFD